MSTCVIVHWGLEGWKCETGWPEICDWKSEVMALRWSNNGEDHAYGSIGCMVDSERRAMSAASRQGMVPWRQLRNSDVLVWRSSSWHCMLLQQHSSYLVALSFRCCAMKDGCPSLVPRKTVPEVLTFSGYSIEIPSRNAGLVGWMLGSRVTRAPDLSQFAHRLWGLPMRSNSLYANCMSSLGMSIPPSSW